MQGLRINHGSQAGQTCGAIASQVSAYMPKANSFFHFTTCGSKPSRLSLKPQTSSFGFFLSWRAASLYCRTLRRFRPSTTHSFKLLPLFLQGPIVRPSLLAWKNGSLPSVQSQLPDLVSVSAVFAGTMLHQLSPLSCPFSIKYIQSFSVEEISPWLLG